MRALEAPSKESGPMGREVSWVKRNMQAFNDIFDAAFLSVSVCGEDAEIAERFTYVGSDIHVAACCDLEVDKPLDRPWGS